MAIRVRTITPEEQEVLDQWQCADNVVGYRRARILQLATCPVLAELLGRCAATVRVTILQGYSIT